MATPSDGEAAQAGDRRRPEPSRRAAFWREALAVRGSVTPLVALRVLAFGAFAALVTAAVTLLRRGWGVDLVMEVAPYEIAGAVLALLLVLRINAGNDRWYEARRLWGGIVNQSRNFAVDAVAYGPDDPTWRGRAVRWAAAFPHVARASLRGEGVPPEAAALVGPEGAARLAAAGHMPTAVALELARLLREVEGRMDRFAFLQADRERAALVDHVGGCERILKTPLPHAIAVNVRRMIVLYLVALPLGLLHEVDSLWLVPVLTMMLAYPLLALDQIGVELQQPFSRRHLSHLPLDDISATIERNLQGLLAADGPTPRQNGRAPAGPAGAGVTADGDPRPVR